MASAGSWDLAANISEHDEDRESYRDVLVHIMLDCSQSISRTHEHLHLHGSECHAREDEDAGSARLRVFLNAEIFVLGGASQEHPAMHTSRQCGLVYGPTEGSPRDHDERRGKGPFAL